MSDKIQRRHLERKAILYVRQSSVHQVVHNRESAALQYAMRDRLGQLGFTRIDTIDDDLGRSGVRQRGAGRVRPHGRGGLPRQGRRRGGPGTFTGHDGTTGVP